MLKVTYSHVAIVVSETEQTINILISSLRYFHVRIADIN